MRIYLKLIVVTGIISVFCTRVSGQCSGTSSDCVNGNGNYSYTGSSNKILWTLSGGGSIVGNNKLPAISVTWTAAGSHTVYLNDLLDPQGSCSISVQVNAAVGGTISSGEPTVCQGSGTTLTLSGHSGAIVRWEKSVNGGSWQNIAHTSSTYPATDIQTQTQFRALISKCSQQVYSGTRTISVQIPQPGSINLVSGVNYFCEGSGTNGVIELVGQTGILKRWEKSTYQSGAWGAWTTVQSNPPDNTHAFSTSVPTRYRAMVLTTSCGEITGSYYSITSTAGTTAGTISANKPSPICKSEAFSISMSGNVGTVTSWEKWTQIHGWTTIASPSNLSITENTQFRATVKNGSCPSKLTNVLVMNVYPTPTASATDKAICSGQSTALSISAAPANVSGTSFSWTSSQYSGATVSGHSANTGSSISQTLSVAGNASGVVRYRITPSANGCTGPYEDVLVTVKPTPLVQATPGSQSICPNGTGQIALSDSKGVAGTTFSWTVSAPNITGEGGGSGSQIAQTLSQTTNTNQTAVYSITATASGCSNTTTATVTVKPRPTVSVSPSTQTICSGSTMTSMSISNPNGVSGTTFSWTVSAPDVGGENNGSGTAIQQTLSNLTTSNKTATYTVVASANGCQSVSSNAVVTINPVSNAGSVSGSTEAYGMASGSLAVSGIIGTIQTWEKKVGAGAWTDTYISSSSLPYTNLTTTTSYSVRVKSGVCPIVNSAPASVTIHNIPTLQVQGPDHIPPGGSTQLVTNTNLYSYEWFHNDVSVPEGSSHSLIVRKPGAYKLRVKATSTSPFYTTGDALIGKALGNQSQPVNHIITTSFATDGATEQTDIYDLDREDYSINVQYFDGLGRAMQVVDLGSSPLGADLIQPVEYDEFGREAKKYLPYSRSSRDGRFVASAVAEQANFYNTPGDVANDANPYSLAIFEPSPLNRVLKQGAPGALWQPNNDPADYSDKTIKNEYHFNVADEVLLWTYHASTHLVTAYSGGNPEYYDQNKLYATKTFDEHNKLVIEYTDKLGRTVLKRVQAVPGTPSTTGTTKDSDFASTYYIYGDFGNLVCVLQPEGVKNLSLYYTASADNQEKFLSNWAFRYKYDGRKRMIEKQVPGAHPVYMVYDNRDRLVLTQDGKQRTSRMWSFTKYDQLNRPILTGIKDTSVTLTQQQMQAVVDTHYNKPGAQYSESFIGNVSGNIHGYSNNTYPMATRANGTVFSYDYLTVTYYDNYDFRDYWSDEYQYESADLSASIHGVTYTQPASEFTRTKSLVTGTRTKVLDGGIRGGYAWLNNVSYYDDRYRVVQTVSENYHGGVDRTSNLYDFTGKVLKTKTIYSTGLITWKDISGAALTGNKIYKNISGSGWNTAGAVSVEQLAPGTDGWVEVTVSDNSTRMVGLADQSPDNHYNTIDYALYPNGSTLRIYESGALKYTVPGQLVPSDRLRIMRTGTTITYYRNNQLVYTSLTPSSTALLVDASFYSVNSSLLNVRASFTTTTTSVTRAFEYDHAGRLTRTWHQLDNDPQILLSHNQYNELGQLIDKKIHSTVSNASDAKQSIDYRYNIRGWLTKMNEDDLDSDEPGDPTDYFSFELGYNNDIGIGNQSLYNGNISGMKWSSNLGLDAEKMKGYVYDYDPMDRITDATYKTGSGNITSLAWSNAEGNAFSEYGYTYDLNGNIKTLNRKGAGGSDMDILQYNYDVGLKQSNKLDYVRDSGSDTTGFREYNTNGSDYAYDGNGNLMFDRNKGGKDVLTNGNFDAGSSSWTINDTGSRFSFVNSTLQVNTGSATSSLTQQSVVQPNLRFIVIIDIERLSTTGSIDINLGGTNVSITTPGLNTLAFQASGGTDFTITPSTDFAGNIHNIEVKGHAEIAYNFLNLPEKVTMGGDQYLSYYYDAIGRKLAQELYKSDKTLLKRSDYIGEYFYENDTLKFINHEEGRVVMTGTEPEYQYHLKDHLGNVRLTFTTKEEIETDVATLEPENHDEEVAKFLYYEEAVVVNHELFDHTSDGTVNETYKATRLVGGDSTQTIGLARSLSVMPGDEISMEVWAKYLEPETENWDAAFSAFITQYLSAPAPGVVIDGGAAGSIGDATFPYANIVPRGGVQPSPPKAFLTWLVFDRDHNPIPSESGFVQIGASGYLPREDGTNVAHEQLKRSSPLRITKPGYVYIYLSNENETPVEVFFDDFTVEHTKSPVVQMDDYYPFGLAFNSYSRENSTPQNFKFNGKEEQKDLGLGWYDYGWRQYDPAIARWMVVDPWATKYKSWSPYNYGFNNPVRYADFMGLGPEDKKGPNGMSETQVYSRDDVGKDKTVTTVTQETRTRTTTENEDGTTTTTMTRSTTTNTVTKDNETGETSTQYGKTKTATYSETTNSDGKVINSSNSATESKTTSQNDKSMKNLNAWTNKISNFNSSHDKTFNQTIARDGRMAMSAAALATTFTLPISGTVGFLNAGGGMIITLSDQALTGTMLFIGTAPAIGTAAVTDVTTSGGVYSHSTSQTKIKEGAAIPLIRHNVLDR